MSDLLQHDVRETFDYAIVPATGTLFATTQPKMPIAAQLQVTGALSTGATVSLATGGSLVIPANGVPVGGTIKARAIAVTFGGTAAFIAYG